MSKDFWQAFGAVVAVLVGTPLTIASMRAIYFFGQVTQSVRNMEIQFKSHVEKMEIHMKEMHDFCEDTHRRITQIEEERKAEEKWGRRAGDHDVTKDKGRIT